jgi:hypothetical protein
MKKDEQESKALVKYEPQSISLAERLELLAARKREELREAIKARKVGDPITAIIGSSYFISAVISTGLSIGSSPLSRALMPKKEKPC